MSIRRTGFVAKALLPALAVVALLAGTAVAHTFFQSTHLSAHGSRLSSSEIRISGRLKGGGRPFCESHQRIRIHQSDTGRTLYVTTNTNGGFRRAIRAFHPHTYKLHYPGRVGGRHPHRHQCGPSDDSVTV